MRFDGETVIPLLVQKFQATAAARKIGRVWAGFGGVESQNRRRFGMAGTAEIKRVV
jgi:hypothetical protein